MAASSDSTSTLMSGETLLYLLNIFCIVPCLFVKFPQFKNVIVARSVKGLSYNGALMETIVYMVGLLYHFSNNFPLMAYAEYVALEIQALMMILLFIYFSDNLDVRILPMAAIFFICSGLIGSGGLPSYVITVLFSMNTPLSAGSKLLQFMTIYRAKNSGSSSFTMWLLMGLTSVGRVFTNILTKPDMLIIGNFTITSSLNFLICGAILYYRPSAKKFE